MITAEGLQIPITADLSQFTSAVQAAQQSWASAAKAMESESSDAGGGMFASFAEGLQETVKGFASTIKEGLDAAMSGSPEQAEKFTVGLAEKLAKIADGFWDSFGEIGEKYFGKLGRRVGTTLGGLGKEYVQDPVKQGLEMATSEEATSWLGKYIDKLREYVGAIDESGKATDSFTAKLEKMAVEFAQSAGFAEKIKSATEGMKQGVDVYLGKRMSTGELSAITAEIDKQTEALKEQEKIIGKTNAEKLVMKTTTKVEGMEGFDKAAEDQKKAIEEKTGELKAAAEGYDAAVKAAQQTKGFEYITQYLERQLELQGARTKEIGKTAGAIAEEKAMIDASTRMQQKGRDLSAEEVKIVEELGKRWRVVADQAAHAKFAQQQANGMDKFLASQQEAQFGLGRTAGDIEMNKAYTDTLLRAKEANIELTEAEKARALNAAEVRGIYAQQTALMKEQFAQMQAYGQAFSHAFERAFEGIINGTFNAKEALRSLAMEIAKLVLRYQILMPLFGGGAANPAGLFGEMLGFGGARAGGGPVSGGTAYLVGEKGPEMFVPNSSGSIIPNGVSAGGGASTINMRVDLSGANGDETIARIASQAARSAAMAAIQQVNDAFPARQRRMQMLGT